MRRAIPYLWEEEATPLKMSHPPGGLFCVRYPGFSIHRNMSPLLTLT